MQNNIFQITRTISQNVLRSYARKAVHRKKTVNPGIEKRIKVLEEDEHNLENIDVDELESDFMSLGDIHRQHEKEVKHYKEKEKYWIIRQKYFKSNKINFLTISDKEQIRYLHQTNPTEWTVERLSEGFPALPETITKIIKARWQKSTDTKEINHDKAVEKNWKLLKDGKLTDELPPNILSHLMKFSNRRQGTVNPTNKFVINTPDINKSQQIGEFASIIKSYDELKNNIKSEEIKEPEINMIETGHSVIQNSRTTSNKIVTLQQWKRNNAKDVATGKQDELTLKQLFQKEDNIDTSNVEKYNINEVIKFKHNTKSELAKVDNKKAELVSYPEKITIPKDRYEKGSTYKVNDCYYDDDGTFLYRVPGMY